MERDIYFFLFDCFSVTFASCERDSTNAIQVKWIPSYSPPFSRERRREDDGGDDLLSFFPFERETRCFESRVDRKPRAFSQDRGPTVPSLFGFRISKDLRRLDAEKGKLSRRRFLVHVLQERSYTRAAFKETTVARGVLSEEFRAEALVVVSLLFTGDYHENATRRAGLLHRLLSNAFALGGFQRESVSSVDCRLSTRRLRRVLAK